MSDNESEENSGKRPLDGNNTSGNAKRSRGGNSSLSHHGGVSRMEMRLLIPIAVAGAIIGKGGKNIQEMRQEFNASIQIPDSDGFERVVCVSAPTPKDLGLLTGRIVDCLKERLDTRNNEMRILIHKSQAGSVIGMKGYKIKELREITGANIKVFQDCCPGSTDRVCQVRGERDTIVHAVTLVLELLEASPPKGTVVRYDPNSQLDESYEYGGYTGNDHSGGSYQGFSGRSGGNMGRNRGGMNQRMNSNNFPQNTGPRSNFSGGNNSNFFGNQSSNFQQDAFAAAAAASFTPPAIFVGGPANTVKIGQTHSSKVTIPTNLAGSIIGKGGLRIKQIRQDCGAKIKIDEAAPGSNDRIITITGTQEQIQNAQYLLQQSVKLFSGQHNF